MFNSNDIFLPAGQSIELLFKFFTVRESDFDPKTTRSEKYIKPRSINIKFLKKESKSAEAVLDINVTPTLPTIDQSIMRYQPEQSRFVVCIPPFLPEEIK